MTEYMLEVAPLANPIKEQLDEQEVYMSKKNYDKYEKIRHAINMLGFHISTESETRRNWKRFYDKIQKDIFDEPVD